jgi:hypothetical protein
LEDAKSVTDQAQAPAGMNKKYFLILLQPEGYIHARALSEMAETVYYGLQNLACLVSLGASHDGDAVNIVFGAHLLPQGLRDMLPANSIIYNSEQVYASSNWMSKAYMELLRDFQVWDYSQANVEAMWKMGLTDVVHVPIGYVDQLRRIPRDTPKDVDVLFYGSMSDRRKRILIKIEAAGLKVKHLFGVYRDERDQWIARSRVVLNMHMYDAKVFEIVRVSYLLTNSKAVVSECSVDTKMDDAYRKLLTGGVYHADYDELVAACVALCRDDDLRAEYELKGFLGFSSVKEEAILSAVIK